MKQELMTDAFLREFLLGKVNDDERERIESVFLTDSQIRERVLALEQDLIEDYLEESLTQEDKERFISLYAQTDEQRRALRITKSIKDWAVTEARAPQIAAATVSVWSRLRARLQHKPVLIIPIVVTFVIAIVLAIVWLNSRTEQRRHFAIEQELAQLNSSTSLRDIPPQAILDLKPVTVRSGASETELKLRADIRIIELRLPWIQSEHYSMYQAEVRQVGNGESFTIRNIQVENDGRNVIRIRLPAYMLKRGEYQINLTGIAADGSLSSSEEYILAISD